MQKLRLRGEQALQRAREGASFAELAASFSDAPDALQGGDLGWRPMDRLPQLYAETAARMRPGDVSDLLRSSAGFHILKLVAKRGGGGPVSVQQTHARHILIRVNEVVSETEARRKMENLRERLVNGGDFAELARALFAGWVGRKGRRSGLGQPGRYGARIRARDGCAEGQRNQPGGPDAVRHAPDPGGRTPLSATFRRIASARLPARPCANASSMRPIRTGCARCATAPTSRTVSTKNDAATHRRHQWRTGRHRAGTLPAPGRLRRAGAAGHSWRPRPACRARAGHRPECHIPRFSAGKPGRPRQVWMYCTCHSRRLRGPAN